MIYDEATKSWGMKQNGKYVSMHTAEEWDYRQEALKKMLSGEMTKLEIYDMQADLVQRRQRSPYSQARTVK